MTKKKFIQAVHRLHGLTPLQRVCLEAFNDGNAHDRVTIAIHLDGGHGSLTRYAPLRTVANEVIGQLTAIGMIRADAHGWYRLVEKTATQQTAPQQARTR